MKPEKDQLIDDLLDAKGRRETILRAGAHILRRRRHWRAARHTMVVVALAVVAAIFIERDYGPKGTPTVPVAVATNRAAPAQGRSLTDEQLLAMFPNTPVGLATLPNGKKMLIFPRPADEARYFVRL
ncbi:MAG TPA: hypothetical protein VGV18_12770 [Verrucomicrobiae bacterium]|nr:hypothetical protein [Verrucomicrobiae bacterium]